MSESPSYATSHLYQSFKAIGPESYRSILRFVEDHSTDISMLPVREYFDLQYGYVAALFETGGYERVVDLTEELLELSIVHNIVEVEGEDAFRCLLYRRANALFHLMQYTESVRICDQLLRLHPNFEPGRNLYEKALYQRPNGWISKARALSVVLFLLAAALIAMEVLVIHNFFDVWSEGFELTRNVSFVVGWSMLLGGDVTHRSWAWWRVRRRQRQYAQKRRGA